MPYSFDFDLLRKYWIDRPAVYHHTMPILQYYALYEALRLTLEEGLENALGSATPPPARTCRRAFGHVASTCWPTPPTSYRS